MTPRKDKYMFKEKLFTWGLSAFVTIALLFALEFYYSKKLLSRPFVWNEYHPAFLAPGENPLLLPGPNNRIRHVWRMNHSLEIHDVIYSIDSHQRRFDPSEKNQKKPDCLIVFGCSFAFGAGVQDNETLPAQLNAILRKTKVYNYGMSGHGAAGILRRLETSAIQTEVSQKSCSAVYVFIEDHIRRTVGKMSYAGTWGADFPHYNESKTGELVFQGSFRQAHPWLTFFYSLAARSSTLKYFNIDFPFSSKNDYRFTALHLKKIREKFYTAFPKGNFSILIFPNKSVKSTSLFVSALEEKGIPYLNYSSLAGSGKTNYWLKDNHPAPPLFGIIARQLIQDLKLK